MKKLKLPAGLLIAAVVFLIGTSSAFACHPEITASVSCKGVVSFTSTAWAGKTDASRTNSAIQVSYTYNGSTVTLPQKASYKFDVSNKFTFSDTFTVTPLTSKSITVTAKAIATWGNGAKDGSARSVTVSIAASCTTTSTSTTRPSTSSSTSSSSTTVKTIPSTTVTTVHRGSSSSSVTSPTTLVTSTIPPTPTLARTGNNAAIPLAITGLVLVFGGLLLLTVTRRRY